MSAVKSAPTSRPSRGLEKEESRLMKAGMVRRGTIASLIIFIPRKRMPKPARTFPRLTRVCFLPNMAMATPAKAKARGQGAHVQSNHLACDGRPDIGAHDDANRLGQCHQPGIDKTHHHHGGR